MPKNAKIRSIVEASTYRAQEAETGSERRACPPAAIDFAAHARSADLESRLKPVGK
jgi:hypothetical protein